MPMKALRPCREPGCVGYAAPGSGLCEKHRREREQERRDERCPLYSTARWRRERGLFLRAHPLCAQCARQGRTRAASQVDHIRPHQGDPALFWDQANWQSLCLACHSRKTAAEDGGFGHARRAREEDPAVRLAAERERFPRL